MTQRGGVALCVLAAAMALLGAVLGAAAGAQSSFIYFNF